MGERVSDSLTIPATAQQVLDVVLDLEAYPQWADGVKSVEITSRDDQDRPVLAKFLVDARVAQIQYVLRYDYSGQHLTWTLEEGEMLRQLDGEYQLHETDGTTDVLYTLEVEIGLPVPGFLKKRAAKSILDTSLRGLRERVATQA